MTNTSKTNVHQYRQSIGQATKMEEWMCDNLHHRQRNAKSERCMAYT